MRVPVLSIVLAVLAVAALLVHLQAPLAETTYKDPDGVLTTTEWTPASLREAYKERDANGVPYEIVDGTGLVPMLISLTLFAAAAIVFAVADFLPGAKAGFVRVGAGVVTAISGVVAFVGNALFTGRGIADYFEATVLGSDGPPALYGGTILDHSAIDLVTSYTPISPAFVTAILFAAFVILALAWSRSVRTERGLRDMAKRHGRLAIITALALAFVLMTPLVSWTLQDNLNPPEGQAPDQDPFLFSAYDVHFYNAISFAQAEDTGEAGLILWSSLSLVLGLATLITAAGVVMAFIGVAGKDLESLDQQVFGRLVENLSMGNILVHAFLVIVAILAAFALQHPTDIPELEATTTGLPLIILPAAMTGLIYAGLTAREVIRDDTGLVADDFTEPVIYD